jgi:hypothetical protein
MWQITFMQWMHFNSKYLISVIPLFFHIPKTQNYHYYCCCYTIYKHLQSCSSFINKCLTIEKVKHYILFYAYMINKCTYIHLFNHILFFSINMFRSFLWPLSGCHNKNTIKTHIIVQKCMIEPLHFPVALHMVTRYQIILSLIYSKMGVFMLFVGYI